MSTHETPHRTRRTAAALIALLVALGCGGDSAKRNAAADDLASAGLSGTWEFTLRLERPLSIAMNPRSLPRTVTGVVVLLDDRHGPRSFEQLQHPTHLGVYDVDLHALGFPPYDASLVPGVAARITVNANRSPAQATRDSVYLVLDPETPRHSVRLFGTFDGGSVQGEWSAESFLGGGGTFTLRRRTASAAGESRDSVGRPH